LWSALHNDFFCFFFWWKYRIGGHAGNIGRSRRVGYPKVAVKFFFAEGMLDEL
jgi:hypothetical protein